MDCNEASQMPTKRELMSSTAEPKLPPRGQAERSRKQPPPPPQRFVDRRVAARERGALKDSERTPVTTTAEPGYPQLPRGPPFGAYSIPEFCRAHSISESFYFQLQTEDRGPAVMRIGRRTLISVEAAQAWRAQQEAAANQGAPTP